MLVVSHSPVIARLGKILVVNALSTLALLPLVGCEGGRSIDALVQSGQRLANNSNPDIQTVPAPAAPMTTAKAESSAPVTYKVACAPKGASRGTAISIGSSPQDPDICYMAGSNQVEWFLVGMSLPFEGQAEGAQVIKSVISNPASPPRDVEMTWALGHGLSKIRQTWENLGVRTLQMLDGPQKVMMVRRTDKTIIGSDHQEGVMDMALPIVGDTVFLMIISQRLPDHSKTINGYWKAFDAPFFRMPRVLPANTP